MKISKQSADETVLAEIGTRLLQRRLELDLTQAALGRQAGVSKRTIERIESGGSTQLSTFIRILRALNLLENFETLVPHPKAGPIEQLDSQGRQRRRASGNRRSKTTPPETWTWGDEQ